MAKRSKTPASPAFPALTDEDRAALTEYATEHGAKWKQDLWAAWLCGDYRIAGTPLYRLRNTHGGKWLAGYEVTL